MRFKKITNNEPQKNQTYEQILISATELFLKKGFNDVTTRDIAAHAGVNLGLIPYYFKSKDNIAAIVMENLNNDLYAEVLPKLSKTLNKAETLYVSTLLLWKYIDEHHEKFVFEYAETKQGYYNASRSFIEMTWEVIKEYDLQVSAVENEIYLAALKGSERLIMLKRNNGDLIASYEDITNLIVSNYFYNIGLSDQTIADIIFKSTEYLHRNHLL